MDAHHHGTVPGLAAPELAHHDHVDLAPLGTAAADAVVTPRSDNAHLAVGEVGGPRTTDSPIFEQPTDDGKLFATLRARLALAGWAPSRTTTSTARVHPLLFDACRCGPSGRLRCLACWRWHRHYHLVMQRRHIWRTAP